MLGDVDDLDDLWDGLFDRHRDPLREGHLRHPAALTAPREAQVGDTVVVDRDEVGASTVRGDLWVDLGLEDLEHRQLERAREVTRRGLERRVLVDERGAVGVQHRQPAVAHVEKRALHAIDARRDDHHGEIVVHVDGVTRPGVGGALEPHVVGVDAVGCAAHLEVEGEAPGLRLVLTGSGDEGAGLVADSEHSLCLGVAHGPNATASRARSTDVRQPRALRGGVG